MGKVLEGPKTIEEALESVDYFPIDDCLTLTKIMLKYGFSELALLNNTLQENKNGKEGIYFRDDKFKFYALSESKQMIEFIVRNYEHPGLSKVIEKLNKKGDPRSYV